MTTYYRSTIWIDRNGRTRQTILSGNATLTGVVDALLNHSVGGISNGWESTPVTPTAEPSTGPYGIVADWVQLLFTTAAGSLIRVTLPAPNSNIFFSDDETVDPSAIADIIAAVVGTLTDSAGNAAIAYISGVRNIGTNKEY